MEYTPNNNLNGEYRLAPDRHRLPQDRVPRDKVIEKEKYQKPIWEGAEVSMLEDGHG